MGSGGRSLSCRLVQQRRYIRGKLVLTAMRARQREDTALQPRRSFGWALQVQEQLADAGALGACESEPCRGKGRSANGEVRAP